MSIQNSCATVAISREVLVKCQVLYSIINFHLELLSSCPGLPKADLPVSL